MKRIKKNKIYITIVFIILTLLVFMIYDLFFTRNKSRVAAPMETLNTASATNQYKSPQEISSEQDSPTDDSISYYNEGLKYFDQKNYNLALNSFSKAIENNPKKDSYYNKKSQAEMNLNMKQAAINTVKTGLANNPDSDLLKSRLDILQKDLKNNQDGVK